MKIVLIGYGKMGKEIERLALGRGHSIVAKIDVDNQADLLQSCVALSGDTDSVAAIAVGIASCFTSYSKNLPEHLKQTLNEPQYGMAYLAELDKQLLAKVSSLVHT